MALRPVEPRLQQAVLPSADLFGDIEPAPRARARDHAPGLLVAVAATLAAGYLATTYGAPLALMALLVGLGLNFLATDPRLAPGLGLAARDLLRVGIILIGVRVTASDVTAIGWAGFAAIVSIMAATFATGLVLARALGFSAAFGTLAGGAVAICGGSAAMALAATLGERRVSQAQVTMVLVGIAAVGAAAMALYPAIAMALGLSVPAAGFLMGAAIHDVAQAVGAGQAVSAEAGTTATIVKLSRVALLAPMLLLVATAFRTGDGGTAKTPLVPAFLVGFFAVAALNSFGLIPPPAGAAMAGLSNWLLAMAIAAAAIRSPMRDLLAAGPRPLLVIGGASLVALALALLAAYLLFP